MLHPPDMNSFPINSRAVYYLVQKGYLIMPKLPKKIIWDKSKGDRFAKGAAFIQSMYILLQCIARPIQQLEVSCFELVTVAFVACTGVTYWFWLDKPLGVEAAINLELSTSMAQVLREAGLNEASQFTFTPMDFVERPGWLLWKRRDHFMKFGGLAQRPIPRIPNDLVQGPLSLRLAVPCWLLTVGYAAIHVAGWNYSFPTMVELYIWRSSSLTMLIVLFLWGLVEVLSVKPGFDFTMTLLGIWEKPSTKTTFLRNWAVDGPATVCATMYFVARTALIVEMFASMRLMRSSVYEQVQWTTFVPHV